MGTTVKETERTMVDFNSIKFNAVPSTGSVGGAKPANAASGGSSLLGAGGPVDSFTPSNSLFSGSGSSGVDFNAIANMSLGDAEKAIPGSFQGLQILANL